MNDVIRAEDAPKRALLPYESAIEKARERWEGAAAEAGLNYEAEKNFALQALTKTKFAMETANNNPLSVHFAMLNLATTGLSLNPALKLAYLVPRAGAIVLEISYIGLLRIATDCGAIRWGRAQEVYEGEEFIYRGPASAPVHTSNPFKREGREIIGVYCIAKTSDGDILCDVMDRAELEKIRSKSDAYTRSKSGPWVEWFSEQCKKAIIKRAWKTWPQSDRMERLAQAIEIANASEGGYTLDAEPVECVNEMQAATLREWIEAAGVDAQQFLRLYDVDTVEALPRLRYAEALSTLKGKCK